ncbi:MULTISPECIES: hypothetical protein [unclassified Streptomyces]|uniref:hypothetical protein n=1 Tax=unclassified Streptomyces TaxID=2593676 RepID=UPI00224F07B5|nr:MULTISPECIES: hypothetical protein [unclassified Streptomyces]MCX5328863.1 hypothetical protein [Streptomyces sp. NBC_00140]MCX5358273.1 hypothetical protein [Streptomyces sp. NBC_00124]
MWFKGESYGSCTAAADSPDLYQWRPIGLAVGHRPHEGPNIFELGGHYWMLVDEWRGQGVLRSDGLATWERQELILGKSGGWSALPPPLSYDSRKSPIQTLS